jgi:nicotinamidase-related amidase
MHDALTTGERDVLLVVDIQNDFCPGGNLAVPHGEEIVPAINRLAERFAHVVLTRTGTRVATSRLHRHTRARNRSKRSRSHTARKFCGRIIAYRARSAQRSGTT